MRLAAVAALLAGLAGSAWAQGTDLRRTLELQGRLRQDGEPAQGTGTLSLEVYSTSSGGSAEASELTSVSFDGAGRFQVPLGEDDPLDARDLTGARFLGVTLDGGSELDPRLELRAAPLALRAAEPTPRTRELLVDARGTPAENGTRLRDAMAAATGASEAAPVLLRLGPGRYDLGTTTLQVLPWVTVQGAGPTATVLEGSVDANFSGVLTMANDAALRDLGIEATGTSGSFTRALYYNLPGGWEAEHVRLVASGGQAIALVVSNGAGIRLRDVELEATSTTDHAFGASLLGPDIALQGGIVSATNSAASGFAIGVRSFEAGTSPGVVLESLEIRASDPEDARAVFATTDKAVRVEACRLHAGGGGATQVGVDVSSGGSARVVASRVEATTPLRAGSSASVDVARSALVGGALGGLGSFRCFGCYDEAFTSAGPTTCP